jgi:hypothetical protein
MTSLSCSCGQVRLSIQKKPDYIHECNCALCRKSGARWGYFEPSEVKVEGETQAYRRADKADPAVEVHFCPDCGASTHFTLTPWAISKFGNSMLGVNMWLADPIDLAGIELRFPNGRTWSGEGGFDYVREPRVLD